MKYRLALKEKAGKLRRKGFSYNEIRNEVKVAKSTLSLWLKEIPLSARHRKRLYTKQIQILSKGPLSQKERRARQVEKIIEEASKEIRLPLSLDMLRLVGAALYWAEGSKRGTLQITNSDPHLVLFMVHWVNVVFGIPPEKLKARLNIYPQQNELEIKQFWSKLLHMPISNFGKSYIKPLSKGYKKNNLYCGTIRVEVPKSVDYKHMVFGWIKAVMSEHEPQMQTVQRKWQKLEKTARPVNLILKHPPIT